MFPLLLTIFLLIQVQFLQAEEFPNLFKHVEIIWNNTIFTDQVTSNQTISVDGSVPSFIFCGPFKTYGKDATCSLLYTYSSRTESSYTSGSGTDILTANMISNVNNTYSCMNFRNPINPFSSFSTFYSQAEFNSTAYKYHISYSCGTSKSITFGPFSSSGLTTLAVFAMLLLLGIGFCGYKCGQKKNGQGGYNNYQGYGANISLVAGGNNAY